MTDAEYTEPDAPEPSALVPAATDALTQFGQEELGLDRAMQVANQLDAIIKEKALSVRIGQGDHLRVEAWCACAAMVGVSPRTVWTKRVPDSGPLEGYIARVEVVQIATGQIIGAAEAGCFMDEKQGSRQRWTDQHAVMSMAQTRATSKAIGQVLRWIPVLAGYSGTPAEEMPREPQGEMPSDMQQQPYQPPKPRPQQPVPEPNRAEASDKQKKMLYAVSMKRAEDLIEERIKADLPLKYGDAHALRGSIAKHASEYVGIGNQLIAAEIEPLKDAIERAQINEAGETFIPTDSF